MIVIDFVARCWFWLLISLVSSFVFATILYLIIFIPGFHVELIPYNIFLAMLYTLVGVMPIVIKVLSVLLSVSLLANVVVIINRETHHE